MSRAENESGAPPSMSQRSSSGSFPWNVDASRTKRRHAPPAVKTVRVMCEESCQWWPRGAAGFSPDDARCMNAVGPRAGSPTGATCTQAAPLPIGRRQVADRFMNRSWGCWRSTSGRPSKVSPVWKICGIPPSWKVAGSREFIIMNVSVPASHGRCAMTMLQLVDSRTVSPEGPPWWLYWRRTRPMAMKLQPGPA